MRADKAGDNSLYSPPQRRSVLCPLYTSIFRTHKIQNSNLSRAHNTVHTGSNDAQISFFAVRGPRNPSILPHDLPFRSKKLEQDCNSGTGSHITTNPTPRVKQKPLPRIHGSFSASRGRRDRRHIGREARMMQKQNVWRNIMSE